MADRGTRARRPRLALGLRGKLIAASLALICVPALFIWSVGIYERFERRHVSAKVGRSADRLLRGLRRRGVTGRPTGAADGWLRRLAAEQHLMVRLIDGLGDLSRDFAALVQRLDAQRRQAAELAGDLAHDLKGPIATVGATAELLESSGELDAARRARLVRSLDAAARHMNRSVEGLLALARLEASLAVAEPEEVDLAALARRVVASYRDDPRAAAVDVALEVAAGAAGAGDEAGAETGRAVPPPLPGVPAQLEQLLRNVVDNALVHCEARILIRLEATAEGGVRLLICDDGPGVSAGNRDKIFRRFFSARADGRGSGLGLTIAAAIVRAHGGAVTLRQAPGTLPGACFEVTLGEVG